MSLVSTGVICILQWESSTLVLLLLSGSSWELGLCSHSRANPAASFLSVFCCFVLCFYWTYHGLLGRNFPSGLLFHYRALRGVFSLHLTHLMPGSVRNESLDWGDFRGSGCIDSPELEDGECCRCKCDLHIQQHEILFLHFAHSHCCSWQRGSTCPSVIPQPQRFPAVSTSEGCVPSSLFIDVPACRHVLISFSRLVIWLTSKLGTQLLPLLKDKKGQQDKGCFSCL